MEFAQRFVDRGDSVVGRGSHFGFLGGGEGPGPVVGEPELGNNVEVGGVGTTVVGGDADVDIIGGILVFRVLRMRSKS